MICVMGDTHGKHDVEKINRLLYTHTLTKNDFIIIAGDFGGVFHGRVDLEKLQKEHPEVFATTAKENIIHYQKFLDRDAATLSFYESLPCMVLFIDGNHENFNELNSYPVEEWNGGLVHKIRPNIYHLMRGQVFTIENKTFFTMGGATSIDKHQRKENVSWWAAELPTFEECTLALDKLDEVNWKVDYVITHSAPDNILYRINPFFTHDIITNFLFSVDKQLEFKHWYFGHYHIDEKFDDKHTCLFQNVEIIE